VLNIGVNGPVVFNILSGTYTGQYTFTEIPGASLSNTITFQSSTSNNNDVTLSYAATNDNNNFVIFLKGGDYLRFKNISIKPIGIDYATVMKFGYGSQDILIHGCKLIGSQTVSTTYGYRFNLVGYEHPYPGPQTISDSLIIFDSNEFKYGGHGIGYAGGSGYRLKYLYVINNTFEINGEFIILTYESNIVIDNNDMYTYNSTGGGQNGAISVTDGNGILTITNNNIKMPTVGSFGIEVGNFHSPINEPSLIANNFFSSTPISTIGRGLNVSYCSNFNIYYNSINILGYKTNSVSFLVGSNSTNIDIKNNIFSNYASGIAIGIHGDSTINCDYNNCYTNGNILGVHYVNSLTSLSTWQTTTGYDLHSVSVPPGFQSNNDLHVSNSILDSAGTPVNYVFDDIDGDIRNAQFPDIGADEFNMYPVDVLMKEFLEPFGDSCCFTSNESLYIRITNAGIDTIDFSQDTAYIHCYSTGTNPFTFPTVVLDTGKLFIGDTLDVLITNNFNMYNNGYYKFYAYLSMPADLNQQNDTLLSDSIKVLQIDSFPSIEDFETYPIGVLQKEWLANNNSPIGANAWQSNSGSAYNQWNYPKPLYDHTYGDSISKYAYVMPSNVDSFFSRVISPCINLDSLPVKSISFWYFIIGTGSGRLHLDIKHACSWVNDIWMMTGPVQNNDTDPWINAVVDLSQYSGQVIIRFRAERVGTYINYRTSFCVDDIFLGKQSPGDAGIYEITLPTDITLTGLQPVNVKIKNFGSDTILSAQLEYSVNGIYQNLLNWSGFLVPPQVSDTITAGSYNFPAGQARIKAWTSLPNGNPDTVNYNDTLIKDIFVCNEILKGSYTIGGPNADFNNFSDAVYILNHCGVDSSVVFLVHNGSYNEQFSIKEVPGASSVNTVTFRSQSGYADSVLLYYDAISTTDNYVIRLDGADNIRFEDISITATDTNFAKVIVLDSSASFNIFKSNIITSSPKQTNSNDIATIFCVGNPMIANSSNSFINNSINFGSIGIFAAINNQQFSQQGWIIKGNTFNSNYKGGCFIQKDCYPVVDSNSFNLNSGKSIEIILTKGKVKITRNKIHHNAGGTGISCFYNESLPINKSLVANNFISMSGTTECSGIAVYDSNMVVCYNSIHVSGSHPSNISCGISESVGFKNNMVVNTGQGYLVNVIQSNQPAAVMDYNNYYHTSGNFGEYNNTLISTFTNWKSISGKDAHSLNLVPLFYSFTDLHTGNPQLDATGIPIAAVTDDIDGDVRDSISPDIGADEFTVASLDAGVVELITPVNNANTGSQIVKIRFRNYGLSTLSSLNLNWKVNDTLQNPFSWTGSLATGFDSDTITLGIVTLLPGINQFKVWTSNPNNGVDGLAANDTLDENIFGCNGSMSGSYSIGGSNADFQSINQAVAALQHCGISGPVVFNINPGVYEEQVLINNIQGLSQVNTVTFQSANGDSTSVVIQYQPTITYADYVIKLEDAGFINFNRITMAVYGSGNKIILYLGQNAHHISIQNSVFLETGPNNNNSYFVSCHISLLNNNRITIANNRFQDNSYGIYAGNSGFTQINDSLIITGNTFVDCSYYAMYIQYTDAVHITENDINNQNKNGASGIFLRYCDGANYVSNNNILSQKEGITLYNCDSTGDMGEISNNMISLVLGASSGIRTYNSSWHKIYYNSVALFQYSGGNALKIENSQQLDIRNNSFSHHDYGVPVFIPNVSAVDTADYNNYYSNGNTIATLGSTNYNNLSQYQQAIGKEFHSINVNPDYYSSTDLHIQSVALDGKAIPISGITTDIDGDTRDTLTPDIGADEINHMLVNLSLVALPEPVHHFIKMGDSLTITPQIKNLSIDTITAFLLIYKYGNQPADTTFWTGQFLPGQIITLYNVNKPTGLLSRQTLKVFVAHPDDSLHYNDTITNIITGLPVITPPFTDNFEGQVIWAAEGSKNTWSDGLPAAATIDTAHSGFRVWATNPEGYYEHDCDDYLYSPYFDFSSVSNQQFSFYNWYETQVNYDLCQLEYSTDGGQNWLSLGYMGDPKGTNWFTHFIFGVNCWTGSNGNW
ncbi:NosD domain-containing protein, partial [Bacteroidota bacterium]